MREKIRIGVIGAGIFGSLHARVYKELPTSDLVAIAEIQNQRLSKITATLGVAGYTDYHDLLSRDDIDAVSICVPDDLHVEPAIAAAEAGKHLLVEKPLAHTPEDCDKIIAAAKSNDVKLMVGHTLRFDPRYVAAKQNIADGSLGPLVHLYARRNNPILSAKRIAAHSSVLFFLGIHDLDFILWCVGKKPSRVFALQASRVLETTPDSVLALLEFPGGTIASLEVCWVLPDSFPGGLDAFFEVVGAKGSVYVNTSGGTVAIARQGWEQPELAYAPELHGELVGVLRDELAHFVSCVAQDRPPLVSGKDGRAAVAVACAIQRSYETGESVAMPSHGD